VAVEKLYCLAFGEKRRAMMRYKRRYRNRDTFGIIRDCQEQTFSNTHDRPHILPSGKAFGSTHPASD
jgi:hypothetical protein